jgi:ABC-type branched-subunit amino acid transport system ATPase component
MGLGRTFQSLEFSPKDTVLDNVLVGAETRFSSSRLWDLLGVWRSAREERDFVDEALGHLTFFQILDWSGERVESVPYAVKKRLQICRALMANPKIIMLDEPASGMSAVEKERLSEALLDLHRKTKIAILIIEHDVGFLTGICQRLIALNFGAMLTEGSCESVTSDQRVIDAYLGNEDDSAVA